MQKNTLVEILFDHETQSGLNLLKKNAKNRDQIQQSDVFCRHDRMPSLTSRGRQQKRKSQIIKITQFNSSIVLGEQFFMKPINSSPNSNQKNFNIKRITDIKTKIIENTEKIAEKQLKKKQKYINCPFTKTGRNIHNKQSIQKILVSTKCNIKIEKPDIQALTSHIIFGEESYDQEKYNFNDSYFHNFSGFQKYTGILQFQAGRRFFESTKGSPDTNKRVRDLEQYEKKECSDYDKSYINDAQKYSVKVSRKYYTKHINQQKKYQENIEKQRKQILELKKQLNKNYAKPFIPPENISATSYIIYQADAKKSKLARKLSLLHENPELSQNKKHLINSHKILVSVNNRVSVEIASLTKIMTCILVLDLSKKLQINLSKEMVTIGHFELNICGTSASIHKGQIYSIQQLLYGLMLPSGNDASLALAVWGGRMLLQRQQQKNECFLATNSTSSGNNVINFKKKECYERFILQMNSKAFELNMEKTKYANSHGLCNSENKSCPYDLAILCQYAMNNQKFRQIVSCKAYEAEISFEEAPASSRHQEVYNYEHHGVIPEINRDSYPEEKNEMMKSSFKGQQQKERMELLEYSCENLFQEDNTQKTQTQPFKKQIRWQNSHLLLQEKSQIYRGIKTGVTDTAGPCLSSCIEIKGRRFIIIVLNCKSMKHRFKDTELLRKWLFTKEEIKLSQKISKEMENTNE